MARKTKLPRAEKKEVVSTYIKASTLVELDQLAIEQGERRGTTASKIIEDFFKN